MDTMLSSAKEMISAAKENPLALIALLIIVAAWVVIALKVRRNQQLLQSLEKLPEKDRLRALEAEMGNLKIKGGISANQWLRHRAQQYYFAAFALVCLLIVILVAIAWFAQQPQFKAGISSTLDVDTVWGERQMAEDPIPPEQTVLYESRLEDGISHIR